MRIYLLGLKNSGKTTAGKKLARKLDLEFLDLDEQIEKNDAGRSVPEIFAQDGEEVFRQKEMEALHQTADMHDIVIATGGGVPRFFDNMQFMKNHGATVYLQLDEGTLVGRLKVAAKNRPIVKGKTSEEIRKYVQDLLANYEHIYLQSDYVVDAKKISPDDLVERIVRSYRANR